MFNRNNQARIDRNQQIHDSGIVSAHFPRVSSIVINMTYSQTGIANPIQRVMNFSPDSHAFFRVGCLSKDCVEGGFDLTGTISSMIEKQGKKAKGELDCGAGSSRPGHSNIVYEIAIKYE